MKKIYTIDKDGFITDNKDVGNNYIMNPDDFEGKPPFDNTYHHITGIERPKSQEQINQEKIESLKVSISKKQMVGLNCLLEQSNLADLLTLSTETLDEKIEKSVEQAIDDYTLELIEGGLL